MSRTPVKTLHIVQVQYYAQFGRYATSLTELGPPARGAAGPAATVHTLLPKPIFDSRCCIRALPP